MTGTQARLLSTTSACHSSSVKRKEGMPNSEVRWMNSRRGIPSSSAALPLETRLRRYNSNTIISRAVCPIGWPRVARKPLRSSPRSRMVESITDAPSSWYRSLPGAENTSVERRSMKSGNQETLGVKANYLASPPLVVAYALAGTMDIDLTSDPLGEGSDGQARLSARHLAQQ